ncbi:MAG: response regulator [Candidatus Omnitrophica bacterium]|nr:response regulator [Candidatus Omnitrophota bacterium]
MISLEQVQREVQFKPVMETQVMIPRIMVVDDDLELLEEIKEVLSFNNYEVEVLSNSALAFEKACELKPDLIITDLKMKPKSGFQLADNLRNI